MEVSHGKGDTGFCGSLVVLGLVGYLGTGSVHPTALIPAWFGLALGIFGFLAISPNEGRRKLFMHINVTIGLLGFLGAADRGHSRLSCNASRPAGSRIRSHWPPRSRWPGCCSFT